MPQKYQMYIDGKWIDSSSKETFKSRNPANREDVVGNIPLGTEQDVDKAVDAAWRAYPSWASTPAPKRGEILLHVAQLLRQEKENLAKIVVREMGKVLKEARGDVQEAIDVFEYMAGEGRRLFGHTTPSELKNKFCMTVRKPIGVVGLITPWNFPTAIPAWKIAPALVCGNTVVFKPASDTPVCAIKLVELLERAGVPKGVVNLVTGPAETVGKRIVTHENIRAISFTGSRDAGKFVLANAGLKKVGLELGGKNPIIVMDDADLDLATEGILWGGFGTTGQRCTAASRVLVHKKVKTRLEKMLIQRIEKLKIGDGMKADVGPLINDHAVEKTDYYVHVGKKEGAVLLIGGKKGDDKGSFYKPTLFTDVTRDMRIAKEEIFGPVVCLLSFETLDEAIEIANDIDYGLSSSIYTNDIANAFKAIDKIEAGITYVNSSTIGAEVHLPFGGVKATGNGTREAGILGIEEFSEIKTVYIDYSGKLQKAQIDD